MSFIFNTELITLNEMKILNYRIKNGETIDNVCNFFKVSHIEFIKINKTENLHAGQIVSIPLMQKCVVTPLDTPESIAKKLLITKSELENKFGKNFFIGEMLEL